MLDWLWTRGKPAKPQSAKVAVPPWTGPRPGASVLYLDFDGVMHPAECGSFCNAPFLQRVLESCPEVDVVLSTNWRINADPEQLPSHFPSDIRFRVVDVTPSSEMVPTSGKANVKRTLPTRRWDSTLRWMTMHRCSRQDRLC
jgi:hypothetical protein